VGLEVVWREVDHEMIVVQEYELLWVSPVLLAVLLEMEEFPPVRAPRNQTNVLVDEMDR
jgi:hypothetical protein